MRSERPTVLGAVLGALAAAPTLARAAEPPASPAPVERADAVEGGADSAAAASSASATSAPAAAATEPPKIDRRRIRWYDVPAGDPSRVSIAAHIQVDLLGLAIGVRPEVLYRPFRATRGANLRFGFGLLPGPEYFFLPIALGWRQHFVPHHRVTLELGAGYEQQFFFVRDAPAVTRGFFYAELGLAVRVASRGWLGVQVAPGWAPFSHPGPGIATRLGFRWDFGGRADHGRVGRHAARRAPA